MKDTFRVKTTRGQLHRPPLLVLECFSNSVACPDKCAVETLSRSVTTKNKCFRHLFISAWLKQFIRVINTLKEELSNDSTFSFTSNTREDEFHRFIKSVERSLAQGFNTAAQDSNPGSRSRESEALLLRHCALKSFKTMQVFTSSPTTLYHFYLLQT